jgi:tRNA U34 5-carboxymethylaminomethyl modifying GTPase MnmE/TrmE
LAVSAQTGQGLPELREAILAKLGSAGFDAAAPMAFTPRQADLLHQAAAAIETGDHALAAERLRELRS